ncbi:MAG: ferrochelatase [Candidatus Binataceae bacterium]
MNPKTDAACDGVMLIGFGAPSSMAEVRPFLDRVLEGRPVPRARYEEVVHHYETLGGRSPYNDLAMRQAEGLRAALAANGIGVPVRVGMRNTPPFFTQALRELSEHGARRVLGLVLSAYQCEASWERYLANVEAARASLGDAPAVVYPPPWHCHPLYLDAAGDRLRATLARLDSAERPRARLIFTAHSIPLAMARNAPYVSQLHESARLITRALGHNDYTLAFQSRSGNPQEPWLEPDVGEVLRKLNGGTAVVAPLGFLSDHVEVLYDLDIEAAQIARMAGVHWYRAATVDDHPQFIAMMAALVRAQL